MEGKLTLRTLSLQTSSPYTVLEHCAQLVGTQAEEDTQVKCGKYTTLTTKSCLDPNISSAPGQPFPPLKTVIPHTVKDGLFDWVREGVHSKKFFNVGLIMMV